MAHPGRRASDLGMERKEKEAERKYDHAQKSFAARMEGMITAARPRRTPRQVERSPTSHMQITPSANENPEWSSNKAVPMTQGTSEMGARIDATERMHARWAGYELIISGDIVRLGCVASGWWPFRHKRRIGE
jgi:hypothetical protein